MSTDSSLVTSALVSNPLRRICVPGMTIVSDSSHAGLDVVPSLLVFESPADQFANKRTTAAFTCPAVEFRHDLILEPNV